MFGHIGIRYYLIIISTPKTRKSIRDGFLDAERLSGISPIAAAHKQILLLLLFNDNNKMRHLVTKIFTTILCMVFALWQGVNAGAFSRRAVDPKEVLAKSGARPHIAYFPQVPCVGCDCGTRPCNDALVQRPSASTAEPVRAIGYRLEASLHAPEAAPVPEEKRKLFKRV